MIWKREEPHKWMRWSRWFAWFPVGIKDQTVWLKWVERKMSGGGDGGEFPSGPPVYPHWIYRLLCGDRHNLIGGPDGMCRDCGQPVFSTKTVNG